MPKSLAPTELYGTLFVNHEDWDSSRWQYEVSGIATSGFGTFETSGDVRSSVAIGG